MRKQEPQLLVADHPPTSNEEFGMEESHRREIRGTDEDGGNVEIDVAVSVYEGGSRVYQISQRGNVITFYDAEMHAIVEHWLTHQKPGDHLGQGMEGL